MTSKSRLKRVPYSASTSSSGFSFKHYSQLPATEVGMNQTMHPPLSQLSRSTEGKKNFQPPGQEEKAKKKGGLSRLNPFRKKQKTLREGSGFSSEKAKEDVFGLNSGSELLRKAEKRQQKKDQFKVFKTGRNASVASMNPAFRNDDSSEDLASIFSGANENERDDDESTLDWGSDVTRKHKKKIPPKPPLKEVRSSMQSAMLDRMTHSNSKGSKSRFFGGSKASLDIFEDLIGNNETDEPRTKDTQGVGYLDVAPPWIGFFKEVEEIASSGEISVGDKVIDFSEAGSEFANSKRNSRQKRRKRLRKKRKKRRVHSEFEENESGFEMDDQFNFSEENENVIETPEKETAFSFPITNKREEVVSNVLETPEEPDQPDVHKSPFQAARLKFAKLQSGETKNGIKPQPPPSPISKLPTFEKESKTIGKPVEPEKSMKASTSKASMKNKTKLEEEAQNDHVLESISNTDVHKSPFQKARLKFAQSEDGANKTGVKVQPPPSPIQKLPLSGKEPQLKPTSSTIRTEKPTKATRFRFFSKPQPKIQKDAQNDHILEDTSDSDVQNSPFQKARLKFSQNEAKTSSTKGTRFRFFSKHQPHKQTQNDSIPEKKSTTDVHRSPFQKARMKFAQNDVKTNKKGTRFQHGKSLEKTPEFETTIIPINAEKSTQGSRFRSPTRNQSTFPKESRSDFILDLLEPEDSSDTDVQKSPFQKARMKFSTTENKSKKKAGRVHPPSPMQQSSKSTKAKEMKAKKLPLKNRRKTALLGSRFRFSIQMKPSSLTKLNIEEEEEVEKTEKTSSPKSPFHAARMKFMKFEKTNRKSIFFRKKKDVTTEPRQMAAKNVERKQIPPSAAKPPRVKELQSRNKRIISDSLSFMQHSLKRLNKKKIIRENKFIQRDLKKQITLENNTSWKIKFLTSRRIYCFYNEDTKEISETRPKDYQGSAWIQKFDVSKGKKIWLNIETKEESDSAPTE